MQITWMSNTVINNSQGIYRETKKIESGLRNISNLYIYLCNPQHVRQGFPFDGKLQILDIGQIKGASVGIHEKGLR